MKNTVFVLFLVFLISGCQPGLQRLAPGPSSQSDASGSLSLSVYSAFYDQADHLTALMEGPDGIAQAVKLYEEQKAFFGSDESLKTKNAVATLASRQNDILIPELTQFSRRLASFQTPLPEADWPRLKRVLFDAQVAANSYLDQKGPVRLPEYQRPDAKRLDQEVKAFVVELTLSAPNALRVFNHKGDAGFFKSYPVPLGDLVQAASAEQLSNDYFGNLSLKTLTNIAATNAEADMGALFHTALGLAYFDRHIEELSSTVKDPRLQSALSAAAMAELGLPIPANNLPTIGFVETTSKTLLRQGQIDFAAEIDLDLPVDIIEADLDTVFSPVTGQLGTARPDYLVIFDVAHAKATRRVVDLQSIPSTLFVGFSRFSGTTAGNVITTDEAARSSDIVPAEAIDANRSVTGKPQGLGDPVMARYYYDEAKITARKMMTVNYYVIDMQKRQYVKSRFDAIEVERFEVGYSIHRNDPRRPRLEKQYSSEKDVDEFEKAAMPVKLSQILSDYASKAGASKKIRDEAALRREMLRDKNRALATFKANTFDSRPLNDPRFDSVVVVYRGNGGLGTGFYITPNVILTNWHVVRSSRIVELKLYDGRESFGTVLGRDARLDVALIRAETRGKPVRFRTDTRIDLGATVEAVGHPRGYEFSITRGVVSAVRKEYSVTLPRRAGDKVLYVQTDAAINPGNSGGPLFLDDYVVGVNTWGRTDADTTNFAVHYGEVLAYLKEHLPGFRVLN